MKVQLNLNDTVYVRLTEHGRSIYDKWASDFSRPPSPSTEQPMSFILWELMNVFGDSLYNGAKTVFADNQIAF
jgi:hypothetical protein